MSSFGNSNCLIQTPKKIDFKINNQEKDNKQTIKGIKIEKNNKIAPKKIYFDIDPNPQDVYINDPSFLPIGSTPMSLKANFKEFMPKKDYYYVFIAERIEISKKQKKELCKEICHLYYIPDVFDVQRFCFYPGTRKIYTFIGFKNEKSSNNEESLKKVSEFAFNRKVFKYPYSFSSKSNDINFQDFSPKPDVFYFFFIEKDAPNLSKMLNGPRNNFGLYDCLDIQRYKYYPGTKKLFTFVGFPDENKREEAKNATGIQKSSINGCFYNFPCDINHLSK